MVDIQVLCPSVERDEEILTQDALRFVAGLHGKFAARRDELLARRRERREQAARTGRLDFLPETADVRTGEWRVGPAPADPNDRRVEVTRPPERKKAMNPPH